MKPKTLKTILLAALLAPAALFADTATTTPVGYYTLSGVAGNNLVVPSLVNPQVFAGKLTAASSSTLTVAAGSLTAGALNAGAVYATHYAEITSGPNAGVILDIASNTASVITLSVDISALNLSGTESIKIRPHVTLKSALAGAEATLAAYTDSATFYAPDGSVSTYYYGGDGATGWSSDFATADGDVRPITPGSGFILGLSSSISGTVSGEVKSTNTVVQLAAGQINIVGLLNPLSGSSTDLNLTGFASLAPFSDSVSIYSPGDLSTVTTYYALGDGTVSSDFASATTDRLNNTTGAVVTANANASLTLLPGFTVGQ